MALSPARTALLGAHEGDPAQETLTNQYKEVLQQSSKCLTCCVSEDVAQRIQLMTDGQLSEPVKQLKGPLCQTCLVELLKQCCKGTRILRSRPSVNKACKTDCLQAMKAKAQKAVDFSRNTLSH